VNLDYERQLKKNRQFYNEKITQKKRHDVQKSGGCETGSVKVLSFV